MDDSIDAFEILHQGPGDDLHFRFIGTAKNRQFVVNVQLAHSGGTTTEALHAAEHDFIIGKVLGLILKQMAENPTPVSH